MELSCLQSYGHLKSVMFAGGKMIWEQTHLLMILVVQTTVLLERPEKNGRKPIEKFDKFLIQTRVSMPAVTRS